MSQTNPKLIGSVADIPKGRLVSIDGGEFPISPEWKKLFAILREGEKYILLVVPTSFVTPQMFELRRRMATSGAKQIEIIQASSDVIDIIYSKSGDAISAESHTDIEKLIGDIVDGAVSLNASDIHIECKGKLAKIFYRVNGVRQFIRDITEDNARSIGIVLYSVHADAGSKDVAWDPGQTMDAGIEWNTQDMMLQLRFASSPIYGGFQIVIRVLKMDGNKLRLDQMGYTKEQLAMLDVMISGSSGMVIMCGPTNSGKSSTLNALINHIYEERGDAIKIVTVEDPVEYVIEGACQIPVARRKKGGGGDDTMAAFTNFLRGTLRQDPDIVMVGETRDADSASVVKDLILAGRKLLTTLHTYSALWSYIRLREIGVPWEIMTMPGFISGIVYQRLVPVLCPDCSIPLTEGGHERLPPKTFFRTQQVADLIEDKVRVQGDGCPRCKQSGYVGRTVCAEFVMPDRTLLKYLSENNFLEAERYWRKSGLGSVDGKGGVTALAHAISKMKQGLLSPLDVERLIGILTADMVSEDNILTNTEVKVLSGSTSSGGDSNGSLFGGGGII